MYRKKWWYRRNVIPSKLHIYIHPDGRVLQSPTRDDYTYAAAGFTWVTTVNKYELNADIKPFTMDEEND